LSVTYGRSVFYPGTPVSSTNKTDSHNITEKLLKVALITQSIAGMPLIKLTTSSSINALKTPVPTDHLVSLIFLCVLFVLLFFVFCFLWQLSYPSYGFILAFLPLYFNLGLFLFFFFLQPDRDCVLWIRSFHKTASFEIPKRNWSTHLGNNKVECLILKTVKPQCKKPTYTCNT